MTRQIPKMIGSDAEFANYIRGRRGDSSYEAVCLLLEAIPGVPAMSMWRWREGLAYSELPTDMGRRYLLNGACFYNDSEHCEGPTPECLTVSEFLHHWRAVLLRLQRAATHINRNLPDGERLCVGVNNSDGHSNSWASHLNVLMTREGFDALFQKPVHFLWLASFLTTSQIYTGAGKVGSENGAPPCKYQLSQRGGDFFQALMSLNTMYRRGLINERDEAHAKEGFSRLHCIYYDSNLSDFATYLKVGALQLACAMLEADCVDSSVLLEDPVEASQTISHSLGRTPVRTLRGKNTTALDLQYRFAESAARFVKEGLADGIVGEAETIITRWVSTLDLLRRREFEKLCRRLDWAAKYRLIERAVAAGRCTWDAPQAKMLDHAYASLDEDEGLFLAMERNNLVDQLTDPQRIAACLDQAPESTRAYARGKLLALGGEAVVEMDWDRITFLLPENTRRNLAVRTFDMSDPLFWSKQNTQPAFENATGLEDALDKLESLRPDFPTLEHREKNDGHPTYSSN